MVLDEGCASAPTTANDGDIEMAKFCPEPERIFLPKLKCVFLVVVCTSRNMETEISRKTSM